MLEKAHALAADLARPASACWWTTTRPRAPGWKYSEHELTGTCLRIEMGPKGLAKGTCVMVRRDEKKKEFVPLAQAVELARAMLDAMQKALFEKARAFRVANTFVVDSYEELKERADDGLPGRPVEPRPKLREAHQGGDQGRHLPQPSVHP